MKVLKFGGTSIGSCEGIKTVVEIISSQNEPIVVVFSAFSGITDALGECLRLASEKNPGYLQKTDEIEKRHIVIAEQILNPDVALTVKEELKKKKERLTEILNGVSNLGEVTARSTDMVLGFGEEMSIRVLYAALSAKIRNVIFKDARDLIFTRLINGVERPEKEKTERALAEALKGNKDIVVMSGYIARSVKGYPTTLGRGGSDYTAALIASAIDAEILEIWTDVSGIYTADPAFTEEAHPIPELSYAEALEISHFGAKVIYPPSIQPVMEKKIPLIVRNTFAKSERGTLISHQPSGNDNLIKAISSLDDICLVSLTGSGMAGVIGTASRMFSALAGNNINVILITQASSEQSICIAVRQSDGETACEAIDAEFEYEIREGRIRPSIKENGFSIIALVGEGMKHSVGISGQAFSALGRNGVNIHAIAQGSSELNISAVVRMTDCHKAVNAIHQEFFRKVKKIINLFVIGTGNVGTAFVEQILHRSDYFISEFQTELRIVGMANSRKMLIKRKGISVSEWKELLMAEGRKTDINKFLEEIFELNLPNSILVDNTASTAVSNVYERTLSGSISVVTSNKIAASSLYSNYRKLKRLAVEKRVHFRFESNVSAGLPIIQTIDNMVKTGDQIYQIEAVLSGSLNFIFNNFCDGMKFSDAVIKARKEGYTESDPLIDLHGIDVARKLLILVREAGFCLETSDIQLEEYLPHPLPAIYDPALFNEQLHEYDNYFENIRNEITERKEKIRIIARYANQKAKITLERVGSVHPFYNLEGNDNIVSIYSGRYPERPLTIKGAGAGADVTASGIFADILFIINN